METYVFKYVLVGDSGVGKSSVLQRFTDDRFDPMHTYTIGVDFGSRIVTVDNQAIRLRVWDTAGQEAYRSITRSYYRDAAVVMLVFDLARKSSFQHILAWLAEVTRAEVTHHPVLVLVGNKCDAERSREVPRDQATRFARLHGMLYYETSARTGAGVDAAFIRPATQLVHDLANQQRPAAAYLATRPLLPTRPTSPAEPARCSNGCTTQ